MIERCSKCGSPEAHEWWCPLVMRREDEEAGAVHRLAHILGREQVKQDRRAGWTRDSWSGLA